MKKKLITSGCSFSSGYGLSDSSKAWPNILGQKLNLPVENYARQGMGNEYIINSVIQENCQDAVVVLGLSSYTRVEFCRLNGDVFTTIFGRKNMENSEFEKLFFNQYYNDNYYYNRFINLLKLFDGYANHNNIKYFMFDALPNKHKIDSFLDTYLWFKEQNMCSITYPHRLSDGHPDETAHEIMAEKLYKTLSL